MNYEEEQVGWWIFLTFIPIIFIVALFSVLDFQNASIPLSVILFLFLTFLITTLLFYKLKVRLDNEYLIVSFGMGLIRKKIKLSSIKDVKKIKTKWYNGWGIRILKNGILYNIKGFDAIELSFKEKNSIVQIGTKPNSNLEREIKKLIKQ